MLNIRPSNSIDNEPNLNSVFWFAVIFAVITYVALSTRAVLSPYEVKNFIDPKRILSIILGASILWLAVGAANAQKRSSVRDQIVAVLWVSVAGTIALLLAREAYDLAVSGELAQRLGLNVRWMVTWIGYFAAGVATFFAHALYRESQAATRDIHSANSDIRPAADAVNLRERAEIADLLVMLRGQLGYESADHDLTSEAQELRHRHLQIDRLLNKFANN